MPPAPLPTPSRGRRLQPWVMYVGTAVVVAGAYLYWRRRQSAQVVAATAASQAATASTAGTQATSGGQDLSGLAPLLAQLQAANQSTAANNASAYIPPSDLRIRGYGFEPGRGQYTSPGATGETFTEIANWRTRDQLMKAGTQVFYQPAPGVFVPWNEALRGSGTRTYLKVPVS